MKIKNIEKKDDSFLSQTEFDAICARIDNVGSDDWQIVGNYICVNGNKVCELINPIYATFFLNAAKDLQSLVSHVKLAEEEFDKMEIVNKALQSKVIKLQTK